MWLSVEVFDSILKFLLKHYNEISPQGINVSINVSQKNSSSLVFKYTTWKL